MFIAKYGEKDIIFKDIVRHDHGDFSRADLL